MSAPTQCLISGNVINMLGSNVQGCTITVAVTVPFIHPSNGSWVSGELSSTTTSSDGNFSLSCVETETPGQRVKFTFDYYDGTANRRQKAYAVVIPNQASAVLTDLISLQSNPITTPTFPAQNVTVNPAVSGETNVQAALEALEAAQLSPTLTNAHIYVGNASNVATSVPVTGDIALANDGTVGISTGVIVNADVNAAAAVALSKLAAVAVSKALVSDSSGFVAAATTSAAEIGYVAGVTSSLQTQIDAKAPLASPSFTGTVTTPLTTAGPVITSGGGVLSSETTLAKVRGGTGQSNASLTFPATGTVQATTPNNHGLLVSGAGATATVVAPDASTVKALISGGASADPAWGNLSPTAGGTGLTTYTTGDVPYASATNTLAKLGIGSSGQFLKVSSGIPSWGPGASGINYLSANPDAEADTAGWATYADAAGTSPVDGTGGSPNSTWTRTTSSPLRGTGSFLFTKSSGASRQGEGVSYAFTLDSADQAKPIAISFDYAIASGTYVDGDMSVWLYDVTNAVVIQPAPYTILSATAGLSQKWMGYFQTSAASTSYRLCIHVGVSTNSANTIKFDNFNVGPTYQSYGAVETDWATYTPIFSASLNTPTSITSQWKRVGDTLHIRGVATSGGTPTGAAIKISLPTGFVANVAVNMVLKGNFQTAYTGGTFGGMVPLLLSADTSNIQVGLQNTASVFIAVNGNTVLSGATLFSWNAEVPIVGWSSNVQVSSDADTRVVAATALSQTPTGTLNGSFNVTKFGTINKDTHTAYATGTGLYAVPVPGWYELNGTIETAATFAINQFTAIALYQNGSGVDYAYTPAGGSMARLNAPYNFLVYANAGDTLGIYTACNGTGPSYTATNSASSLHIKRVSGPAQIAASETVAMSYNTTAVTLTNSAQATVTYTSKEYDTHNAYSGGVYTVPSPGKYRVSAMLTTNAFASGAAANTFQVIIHKNSTDVAADVNAARTTSSIIHKAHVTKTIQCVAGDTIAIQYFHSLGATPTIDSASTDNYVSIERVGN